MIKVWKCTKFPVFLIFPERYPTATSKSNNKRKKGMIEQQDNFLLYISKDTGSRLHGVFGVCTFIKLYFTMKQYFKH